MLRGPATRALWALLLLEAALLAGIQAGAQPTQEAGFLYRETATDIIILGYSGTGGSVNIPDTLAGKPVTHIGSGAFTGPNMVTEVRIPPSVIAIEPGTFAFCTQLTNVSIPNSVASIGEGSFIGCSALVHVTIPEGVTNIGNSAFSQLDALMDIRIPKTVTHIGAGAFSDCNRVTAIAVDPLNPAYTSIDGVVISKLGDALIKCPGGKAGPYAIPEGVTRIGPLAFDACMGLTDIRFSASVGQIGEGAFLRCTHLTNVIVPEGVVDLGSQTFFGCTLLQEVTLPSTVTRLGASTFSYCTSLQNVNFSDHLTNLEDAVFLGCTALTRASLPHGLTQIGSMVFEYCSGLTNAVIPRTVTRIGSGTFSACPSLKEVTFEGNAPAGVSPDMFAASDQLITVYYPAGANGWNPSPFESNVVLKPLPGLALPRLVAGQLQTILFAPASVSCVIEVSSDLRNWVPAANLVVGQNGMAEFHEAASGNATRQFFRAFQP